MKSRKRVVLVLAMAGALVWALAAPGAAKKPVDSPGNSPFGVSVEVAGIDEPVEPYVFDGDYYPFYWPNAEGDQLRFVVTVYGPPSGTIVMEVGSSAVSYEGSFVAEDWAADPVEFVYEFAEGHSPDLVPTPDGYNEREGTITARFTITADDERVKVVDEVVGVHLFPECSSVGLSQNTEGSAYFGEPTDWCRWIPGSLGMWYLYEQSVEESAKRPVSVGATLRDHVPGNWCMTSEVGGRTRGGEWFGGTVFLPDSGICLSGGAGGFTMGVGQHDDFVLATGARIVFSKVELSGTELDVLFSP